MAQVLSRSVGVVMILIGIPIFILPIPFGFVLIGVGIALLLGHSVSSVVALVRKHKKSSPSFDRFLNWTQAKSPLFVRKWLAEYEL